MNSIRNNIRQTVADASCGSVFFISDFANGGNDVFISRLLSELVDEGALVRLAGGIFAKVEITRIGPLYPSVEVVLQAIARRDNAQILPVGEAAENMLGLSTQVPVNPVFITTGSAREIKLGHKTVKLKRSAPRNFAYKNRVIAILVLAMKSIGKDNLYREDMEQIKKILNEVQDKESLQADINLAPIWIKKELTRLSS